MTVEISKTGATIQSVKSEKGTEFIWQGDERIWAGRTPILFPICGGLKEDKYTYKGKEYTLQKHGFIRFCEFDTEEITDTKAVLVFKSNDDTKKSYPFDFEFRTAFELSGNELKVSYITKNTSDDDMYFSVGAHEGYNCPEGIEEYDVIFEESETLNSYQADGNLITDKTICVMENDKVLPLKCEYFAIDALVFRNLNSRSVKLSHRHSSKSIEVSFPKHNYFLLWTKPSGEYICIEPWCGFPDVVGSDYDITHKEGIIKIAGNEEHIASHTIKFTE